MKYKILLITIFLSLACALSAQSITAKVHKTVTEVDDNIVLTIIISKMSGDVFPELPSMPNFNVSYMGFSMGTHEEGQKFEIVMVYMYRLVPRFEGKAVIAPITVNYLGKTYSTEPINIDVYKKGKSAGATPPAQGTAAQTAAPAPAAAQPKAAARPVVEVVQAPSSKSQLPNIIDKTKRYDSVFLMAKTDKQSAYVGEQITLNIGFFTALNLYQPVYNGPIVQSVTKEELDKETGKTYIGGKEYGYNLMPLALFGSGAGIAQIGAARVDYYGGNTGNSVLDSFFNTRGSVTSTPLSVTIKPLPKGAGDYFTGAVGEKFSIKAEVDQAELDASDAVTLTLTVRGVGNLKTVSKPKIDELEGFKFYDVAGNSNSTEVNGLIQGFKTFKTVMVPSVSGQYTLPAVAFTYFSPSKEEYITVRSEPVNLKINPSKTGAEGGAPVSYASGSGAPAGQELRRDINYIKFDSSYSHKPNLLARAAGFGKLNLIPFLLLILALAAKGLAASGIFERAITKAKSAAKNAKDADGLEDAVTLYISKKTALQTGSMRAGDIAKALTGRGVSSATLSDMGKLYNHINAAKYAPEGDFNALEFARLKQETLRILRALEREIK